MQNLIFEEKPQDLRIKRVHESSKLPTKGSVFAAGYDLYSCENKIVKPKDKAMINIGIQMEIPPNSYGRVAPRSGLTMKYFIDVGAGVIDEDYRGTLCVILFNFSDTDFEVHIGDRIAQLIIERITPTTIKEVNQLEITQRGNGGLGSTGINEANTITNN